MNIKFYGSDSVIKFIGNIPKMKNVKINCGSNCKIVIGKSDYRIKNLFIDMKTDNSELIIGENFSIESGKFDFHGEPNLKIEIGNDCQFGCNVEIDTADGHTIYDMDTNAQLNLPQNVKIGNHVWLCKNVSVLKGAIIQDNTVAGKGSIISSKFNDSNIVIAGIPAKIIKSEKYQNINWSRKANRDF